MSRVWLPRIFQVIFCVLALESSTSLGTSSDLGILLSCHARKLHGSSMEVPLHSLPIVYFSSPLCQHMFVSPPPDPHEAGLKAAPWQCCTDTSGTGKAHSQRTANRCDHSSSAPAFREVRGHAHQPRTRARRSRRGGSVAPRENARLPRPQGALPAGPARTAPPTARSDPPRPCPAQRWRRSPRVCPLSRWPFALPRPGAPSGRCSPLGARPAAKGCAPGVPRAGGAVRGSPGAVVRDR